MSSLNELLEQRDTARIGTRQLFSRRAPAHQRLKMDPDTFERYPINVDESIQQIHTRIWRTLTFAQLKVTSDTTKSDMVRAYCLSVKQLDGYAEEAEQFLKDICRCNVYVKRGPSGHAIDQVADEQVEQLSDHLVKTNFLTQDGFGPDMFYKTRAELFDFLKSGLAAAHDLWLANFVDSLDALSEKGIVGHIRWTVPGVCEINHRHRRIVCRDVTETRRNDSYVSRETQFDVEERAMSHGLMEANVSQQLKTAPRHVATLWHKVPEWLHETREFVDGELFLKKDETQRRKQGTFTERIWRPVLAIDPAITILGNRVLAMWDPEEHVLVNVRESPQSDALAESISIGINWALCVGCLISSLMLTVFALRDGSLGYLACAAGCFAIGALFGYLLKLSEPHA